MKFLLLSVAAAFDQEMVNMLKSINAKPTLIEIQSRMNQPVDEEVDAMSSVSSILQHHMAAQLENPKEECSKCIGQVVKVWYDTAFKKTKAWCEKPSKCKVKERLCRIFKNEPEIFAGMLFIWGHPSDDGLFFCMGKGKCTAPAIKSSGVGQEDMMESVANITMSSVVASAHDESASTDTELYQTEAEIEDFFLEEKMKISGSEFKDDFKTCVKKASCWVMKHVIEKICDWCKKATKKEDIEKCKWMQAHKKFTFGILLASVQPWKYAEGYCYQGPKNQFETFQSTSMQHLNKMSDKVQQGEEHFIHV